MGNKSRSQAKSQPEKKAVTKAGAEVLSGGGFETSNLTTRDGSRSSENKLSKPQAGTSISTFKISSSGQVNEEKAREFDLKQQQQQQQHEQWSSNKRKNGNNRNPPFNGEEVDILGRNSIDQLDYDARENPSKITHGFWLQQYSWLHKDTSLGCAITAPSASTSQAYPSSSTNLQSRPDCNQATVSRGVTSGTISHASPTNQPARYRQDTHLMSSPTKTWNRKQKLLNKWNNLVKSFGGSTSESINQAADEAEIETINQSQFRAASSDASRAAMSRQDKLSESCEQVGGLEGGHSSRILPSRFLKIHFTQKQRQQQQYYQFSSKSPSKSGETIKVGGDNKRSPSVGGDFEEIKEREQKRKEKSWFMKSLSSSTSTLLSSFNHQHHHHHSSHLNKNPQVSKRATQQRSGQVLNSNQGSRSQSSCVRTSVPVRERSEEGENRVDKFITEFSSEQLLADDSVSGLTKPISSYKPSNVASVELKEAFNLSTTLATTARATKAREEMGNKRSTNSTNSPYKQIAMVLTGISPIKQLRKRASSSKSKENESASENGNRNRNDNKYDNNSNNRSHSQHDSSAGTCGGSAGNILAAKTAHCLRKEADEGDEDGDGDEEEEGEEVKVEKQQRDQQKLQGRPVKRGRFMQFALVRSRLSNTSSKWSKKGPKSSSGNILAGDSAKKAGPIELYQHEHEQQLAPSSSGASSSGKTLTATASKSESKTKQTSHLIQSILASPKLFKINTQNHSPDETFESVRTRNELDQEGSTSESKKKKQKRRKKTTGEEEDNFAGSDKRFLVEPEKAVRKAEQELGEAKDAEIEEKTEEAKENANAEEEAEAEKPDEIDLAPCEAGYSSITASRALSSSSSNSNFQSGKNRIGISQLIEREKSDKSSIVNNTTNTQNTTYNTTPTLLGQFERAYEEERSSELTSKEKGEEEAKEVNCESQESSNFKQNIEQKQEQQRATQLDHSFSPRFPRFRHEERKHYANEFQTTLQEAATETATASASASETITKEDANLNGTTDEDENVTSKFRANKELNLADNNEQREDSYVLSENYTKIEDYALNVETFASSTQNENENEKNLERGDNKQQVVAEVEALEHEQERKQRRQQQQRQQQQQQSSKVGRQEQASPSSGTSWSKTRQLERGVERKLSYDKREGLEETSTNLGREKCSLAIKTMATTTTTTATTTTLTTKTTMSTATDEPATKATTSEGAPGKQMQIKNEPTLSSSNEEQREALSSDKLTMFAQSDNDDEKKDKKRKTTNELNEGGIFLQEQQPECLSLLPLIQPLASSSSSFGSTINLDSDSELVMTTTPSGENDSSLRRKNKSSVAFLEDQERDEPGKRDNNNADDYNRRENADNKAKASIEMHAPSSFSFVSAQSAAERPASQPVISSTKDKPTTTTTPTSNTAQTAIELSRQKASKAPSSGVSMLSNNFKKLVKRQQSVDSYRMARDLKNKQKRQQESALRHQSNDAIKDTDQPLIKNQHRKFSMRTVGLMESSQLASRVREQAMNLRNLNIKKKNKKKRNENEDEAESEPEVGNLDDDNNEIVSPRNEQPTLKICIDPYAKPGSFTLPGQDKMNDNEASEARASAFVATSKQASSMKGGLKAADSGNKDNLGKKKVEVTPPNTLSLLPTSQVQQQQQQQPGAFVVGSFSGCITPTYPTHHFPSPKYVSPSTIAAKKYSNASTISSLGGESLSIGNYNTNLYYGAANQQQQKNQHQNIGADATTTTNQSDTESSIGGGSVTPSRLNNNNNNLASSPKNLAAAQVTAGGVNQHQHQQQQQHQSNQRLSLVSCGSSKFELQSTGSDLAATNTNTNNRPSLVSNLSDNPSDQVSSFGGAQTGGGGANVAASMSSEEAAAAAARRANLAEHIYDNKCGLGEDMKFLASLPELCDITFLVGETREPVCAVKSVLAARSRVFHKILFGNRIREQQRLAQQQQQQLQQQQQQILSQQKQQENRRGSSPKQASHHKTLLGNKSSSPLAGGAVGNTSPQTQQQQQQQQQQLQQQQQYQPQQWSVTSDTSGYKPPTSTTPIESEFRQSSPSGGSKSGRASVSRSGRGDSISQVSQTGSQQPLIIGPGQMAAPAKRNKKSSIRDSRLSRMFMRRASDPSIKPGNQLLGLSGTNHGGVNSANYSNQNYLDKMSSSQMSTTMIIEEFEPDVFRQLIEYIHTGCVLLQARTLLGLLNAADYYGLEQLRKACLRFVSCCITVDTVCSLLSTAERYIQYKCTKSIVQKVLEFVDTHADEIFKLNAFGLLPEHVVRLILARDGLQADEQVKYSGVYTWCEHYCRSYELTNIADVMRNFLDLIQFHKIPTNVLLSEIYPTHIVPDNIFLSALAYQADPQNFEPQPSRARRMTLPNPVIYKDYDDDYEDDDDADADVDVDADEDADEDDAAAGAGDEVGAELEVDQDGEDVDDGGGVVETTNEIIPSEESPSSATMASGAQKHESRVESFLLLGKKRKSGNGISLFTGNSNQNINKQQASKQQKSISHELPNKSSSSSSAKQSNKHRRKSRTVEHSNQQNKQLSIAQTTRNQTSTTTNAPINSTTTVTTTTTTATVTSSNSQQLRGRKSIGSQAEVEAAPAVGRLARLRKGSIAQVSISGVMRLSHKLSIKKRHSNLSASASTSSKNVVSGRNGSIAAALTHKHHAVISRQQSMATSVLPKPISGDKNPMEVGQKILNAYLVQQRQRELEEEQERLRKEEQERQAAKESKRRSEQYSSQVATSTSGEQQQSAAKQQPIVKVSSTRKSFRDFKHISRRIFMRHPSSKMLTATTSLSSTPISTAVTTTTTTPPPPSSSPTAITTTTPTGSFVTAAAATSSATVPGNQAIIGQRSVDVSSHKSSDKDKRRNLLKIKRSETVFETTPSVQHKKY